MTDTPKKTTGSAAGGSSGAQPHAQPNLQRLDRLANLGMFSASVAHEIKNGLVAINTYCEILMEKGENREMADLVRRELSALTAWPRKCSRFAAPRPATSAPVAVHAMLDNALRLLEHQMSAADDHAAARFPGGAGRAAWR